MDLVVDPRFAAKSPATRMAFLIAYAVERPWQTMQPPLTPSSGRAAVLGVVHRPSERLERAAGKERAQRAPERVAEQLGFEPSCPSSRRGLRRLSATTLPMNPSHTITSALPLKMSRPSALPMKLSPVSFRTRNVWRVSSLPFPSSSPIERSPTRGSAEAEEHLRVEVPHDGELAQVMRLAVDVRADVEKDGVPAGIRDDGGERGAVDPFDHPHHEARRGPRRAGVAGGNERRPPSPRATRFGADAN